MALDYDPTKDVARLLEVRLHAPADVKILGESKGGQSLVYCDGMAFVCTRSGAIDIFPVAKSPKLNIKNLRKAELIQNMQDKELDTRGTVPILKERLKSFLKKKESDYLGKGIKLDKLLLSEKIKPSKVAVVSDTIIVSASDESMKFFMVTLEMDGILVKGNVSKIANYPDMCVSVISLCYNGNCLYISYKGNPGGVFSLELSTLAVSSCFSNSTQECSKCSHIAPYRNGIIFVDVGNRCIKVKNPDAQSVLIAGSGKEGNTNGLAKHASFAQPMGICVENDTNIFITDAQAGTLKIITTINGMREFLQHLGLLYKAFSVHMKLQPVENMQISDAITNIKAIDTYIKNCAKEIKAGGVSAEKLNGPQGAVSHQSALSVERILARGKNRVRDR